MGKVKRTVRTKRATPFGHLPLQDTLPSPDAQSQEEEKMTIPVFKKLEAPVEADRVWAVASLSNLLLTGDASVRRLLLSRQLIPLLLTRCTDGSLDVLVEVTGALRNLTSTADPEEGASKECWREGILTHIVNLLNRAIPIIQSHLAPSENTTTTTTSSSSSSNDSEAQDAAQKVQTALTLLDNTLALITSLVSDLGGDRSVLTDLLTGKGAPTIPSVLSSCIQYAQSLPGSLMLSASYCIYVLSTEAASYNLTKRRRNTPPPPNLQLPFLMDESSRALMVQTIMNLGSSSSSSSTKPTSQDKITSQDIELTRILLIGSLWQAAPSATSILAPTLPFLLNYLQIPLADLVNEEEQIQKARASASEEESILDTRYSRLEDRWNGLQLTLELLANMCVQDWEEEEEEEVEEDEEMGVDGEEGEELEDSTAPATTSSYLPEEALDLGMAVEEEEEKSPSPSALSSLQSTLQSDAWVERILQPLVDPSPTGCLEASTSFREASRGVQIRALGCIGNWLAPQAANATGWFQQEQPDHPQATPIVQSCYRWVVQLLGRSTQDPEIIEAILTSLLWTLARGTLGRLPVTEEDLQGLLGLYHPALQGRPEAQTALVGLLGQVARRPLIQENRQIGQWLMRLLEDPSTGASQRFEAVDALFDIYSDAAYPYDEPVFVQEGMLDRLKDWVLPELRQAIRKVDRRRQRELRARGDLALVNLREFIKYKAGERK